MEIATVSSLQKIHDDLQKELDSMNAETAKPIEPAKKNIFKTDAEAEEFLNTPEARENKMVKWEIRKDCYMVNSPERIDKERKMHEDLAKLPEWQRKLSVSMAILGITMAIGVSALGNMKKRKLLELKLKYVKSLQQNSVLLMPSEKIFSILQGLVGISYQKAEVKTAGATDVYIWLFGVKRSGIREDLDLFDIHMTIFLKNSNRNKVRHCQFDVYYPSQKYSFAWGRIKKRVKRVEFPWKTGCLGNSALMLNRLKRSIEFHPKPNSSVRNLYAATSIPNLRKVLPEVEEFLKQLYPQLFRDGDYMDWGSRKIKKTLDQVIHLKNTLVIPPKQPLAIGVDETEKVVEVLISSLKKWHREKTKTKNQKK